MIRKSGKGFINEAETALNIKGYAESLEFLPAQGLFIFKKSVAKFEVNLR